MKIKTIIIYLLLALPWAVAAQTGAEMPVSREIGITEQQTTSLLFPYPITSVDRGSQDVLAQKPKDIENVLQIKAAQPEFIPSNLTVITSDGKLYNFYIYYATEPDCNAYDFTKGSRKSNVSFSNSADEDTLDALASRAYHHRERIDIAESDYGISLAISGVFIDGDHLYYRMHIKNNTNISYDVGLIRFLVKDQKRSRRTASQELELEPVKIWNAPQKIPAQGMRTFVAVLPKFTIPNKKNLIVQLVEDNGGRQLELMVKNRKLDEPIPLF